MAKKKARGFTIIELTVVAAIIAVLAGTIFVAYDNSKKKSRDSRRVSDVSQISTALQMFYDTKDNKILTSACGAGDETFTVNDKHLNNFLVPDFIPSMPKDPLYPNSTENHEQYLYVSTDGNYASQKTGVDCSNYDETTTFNTSSKYYFVSATLEKDSQENLSWTASLDTDPVSAQAAQVLQNLTGPTEDWSSYHIFFLKGPR